MAKKNAAVVSPAVPLELQTEHSTDFGKAPDKLSSACRMAWRVLGEETEPSAVWEWISQNYETHRSNPKLKLDPALKFSQNSNIYTPVMTAKRDVFGGAERKPRESSGGKDLTSDDLPDLVAMFDADFAKLKAADKLEFVCTKLAKFSNLKDIVKLIKEEKENKAARLKLWNDLGI